MTPMKQQDPRTQYATLPLPEPKQTPPGSEAKMAHKPDYGEDSYVGSGKLEGRAAIITGGGQRHWPGDCAWRLPAKARTC